MSEADPRGIDPELYEYLEAAQELDEISVAEAARREQSAKPPKLQLRRRTAKPSAPWWRAPC